MGCEEIDRNSRVADARRKVVAKCRASMAKVVPPPKAHFRLDFTNIKLLISNPTLPQLYSGASRSHSHRSEVKSISKCLRQAECLHISHRMSRLRKGTLDRLLTRSPERDESRREQRSGRKMMKLVVVFPHASKREKERNSTELIFSKHIKHIPK